jgi:hypothetical protein
MPDQFHEAIRTVFPFLDDAHRHAVALTLICPTCSCANTTESHRITLHRDGTAHCHQCGDSFPVKDT